MNKIVGIAVAAGVLLASAGTVVLVAQDDTSLTPSEVQAEQCGEQQVNGTPVDEACEEMPAWTPTPHAECDCLHRRRPQPSPAATQSARDSAACHL